MEVFYSREVQVFIESLDIYAQARLDRVRKLFEEYGFQIGSKYIKKITKSGVWELRAGNVRLFLCFRGSRAYGIHIILKKSQKLSKQDIDIAEKRNKQL
mgnify:CR=1 FL=1